MYWIQFICLQKFTCLITLGLGRVVLDSLANTTITHLLTHLVVLAFSERGVKFWQHLQCALCDGTAVSLIWLNQRLWLLLSFLVSDEPLCRSDCGIWYPLWLPEWWGNTTLSPSRWSDGFTWPIWQSYVFFEVLVNFIQPFIFFPSLPASLPVSPSLLLPWDYTSQWNLTT